MLAVFLYAVLCHATPARADESRATPASPTGPGTAINDFGFRLLRTLASKSGENVFISPLGVSLALAMAHNGAAGSTQVAIAKTLGLGSFTDDQLNHANYSLLETLKQADPAVRMEITNALWTQSGFPINPGFLKVNQSFYDAPAQSLDFAGNPEHAVDTINGWVNEKTHGKIPAIVQSVNPGTRLILTDAVYFKGLWKVPFDKHATAPRTFHLQAGGSVDTPMMVKTGRYPYFENENFQAIRLSYGNERFAMYVFLARKKAGLRGLISSLDEARWREWIGKLADRPVKLVLPRLELKYGKKLNDPLKLMGMTPAFDSARADFSRIHIPPPPLSIDDVEHKTYVKVDEEGTEAAAATSVGITATAIIGIPMQPFEMIVDHSFFCAIAEQQSGALLFAGIITDPTVTDFPRATKQRN